MTEATNPLQPPLTKLFRRAHLVYGLLFFLKNQLEGAGKQIKAAIEANASDRPAYAAGVSLPVLDLTGPTDNGWALYYAPESFGAQDEDYLEALGAIVSRNASWAVSQIYEAFETFLKDTLGAYYEANPTEAPAKKVARFDGDRKSGGLTKGSFDYWRAYAMYVAREADNAGLFKLGRRLAPDLQDAERHNQPDVDLVDWYAAASKVRHAVTHAEFEVKPEEWHSLEQDQKLLLQHWFPCRMDGNRRVLRLTAKKAERAIRMFLQYAFTIFKSLSKVHGYDWNILQRGFRTGPGKP